MVPDHDWLGWKRVTYGGIRLLDGTSGQPRWSCPLWPGMNDASDSVIHLLEAPDLDADGTREIIVVSRYTSWLASQASIGQPREPSRIYVDAVSGKTGQKLWHWRTDLNHDDFTPVGAPFWWGRGPDGWPMLGLAIGSNEKPQARPLMFVPDPPVLHLLAAATGREVHTIEGLSSPRTADLDGDGLADLWGEQDGAVCAFRGHAPEAWRALGGFQPAGDMNGDGIADVVSNDLAPPGDTDDTRTDSRTVIARSGRDGRMLWRTPLDSWNDWSNWSSWTRAYAITPLTLPAGDLNDDGVPDVLVQRSIWGSPINTERAAGLGFRALSGRSGHELWSSGPLSHVAVTSYGNLPATAITACPTDREGGSDLYVSYLLPIRAPERSFQPRIARVSGRDGRVVWDVLLTDNQRGTGLHLGSQHQCADLDGDGALEVVVLIVSTVIMGTQPEELRVLSAATGETRWSHPLDTRADGPTAFVVGDLEGDGRSEVVVCEQLSPELRV